MPATIVFVPGFWEGPRPFDECSKRLEEAGFETYTASFISCGRVSEHLSMNHDIASIRATVRSVVDDGKEVILVLHSAGGFVGSAAVRGLSVKERQANSLQGGISKLVYLTAALLPEGTYHANPPFYETKGAEGWPKDPRSLFFNDMGDEEAKYWTSMLQPMPSEGWNDTIFDCAWRDIPSVYLLCTKDQCIPIDWQRGFAEKAGCKVVECDAGHMPQLSQPQTVVDLVIQVAEGKL